ncbi:MAG: general secretion pathway protein GspK [Thermomonas sp.]|uniref:general secretion pathway protein GspK n=1 Tax=Thermomonas sp. TaxID=1971895 RepID=UPI001EB2563C|nr:type II secretion system protein GspK [Thermomonas sp.]MBV2209737.1 general secretion pathway protein GspK [Thermomonas sp.]
MQRIRGAALLLVLWCILLLSMLVAGYALTARIESMQGNGAARALVSQEAARAGLELAVSKLLEQDPAQQWRLDGRVHEWTFADAAIVIRLHDEASKIDLNAASFDLLQAFFIALGEPREGATQLAGAVLDWRDPDHLNQPAGGAEDPSYAAEGLPWGAKDAPFESVSELQQVLGMRRELYAAAATHLTVYSGQAQPNGDWADAVVRRAMGLPEKSPADSTQASPISGSGTYSIDSVARLADGRGTRLSAVIRLGGSGLPGSTYTTLHWQQTRVGS